MKTIKVSHLVATVDDQDYPLVSRYKWWLLKAGYAYTQTCKNGKRTTILMHRLILGTKPGQELDHEDLNKLNNQRSNLRLATRSQNNANRRPLVGFKGVRWSKNAWQAEIKKNGKSIYIGRFKNSQKAAMAYDKKAAELFGKFAYLNFPKGVGL